MRIKSFKLKACESEAECMFCLALLASADKLY